MSTANSAQIAYWNGPSGKAWVRAQAKRDSDHAIITHAVLALAAPKTGDAVIDVGCGSGTTTMMIAERVGAKGSVTGVDISKPMLELARARARENGSTAKFIEADITDHRLDPRSVDLVFSQFGVMFFADPVAAFTNLHRALRPGGRLAFACWRDPSENPWAQIPESAAKPFLPPALPADPNAPGRYSFANPERVKNILVQAGFQAPSLKKFDCSVVLAKTPEEAAADTIEAGPLMRTLADADDETRRKVRRAVEERLAEEMQPDGVVLTQAVWLVAAQA